MSTKRKTKKRKDHLGRRHQRTQASSNQQAKAVVQTAFAFLQQREFERAKELCCQGLQKEPRNADLWHVLGLTLMQSGYLEEAISALEQSRAIEPNNAALHSNLGSAYLDLGNVEKGTEHLEVAVKKQREFPQAHNNLGNAYRKLRRIEDAETQFRTAISQQPDYPEALNNLAALQLDQGKADEAIQLSQRAIQFHPQYAGAFVNLGYALMQKGQRKQALEPLRRATELNPILGSTYLYRLSMENEITRHNIHSEHRWWGQKIEARARHRPLQVDLTSNRRLRIGYVSPDFRRHVVPFYVQPVIENHNREEFEIYCYAEVAKPDDVTAQLQSFTDHWRWTHAVNDNEVASQIQKDQIDLLVDLAGHTTGNRLPVFAQKPAPLQLTWIGYPYTTGLTTIDYRISHPFLDPPEEQEFHTEQLLYLPSGVASYRARQNAPPVVTPPYEKNGYLTFGSLHRLEKINETTLELWCDVLRAVKDSRLLMFWPTLKEAKTAELRAFFASRGIDNQRIDMQRDAGDCGYLSVYNQIDIALDVHPWTGGTTTREALWMGVAVIALYGVHRASRGSASVLHQLGLDEYIADSFEQYVSIAKGIAENRDELCKIRCNLRPLMRTKLCDEKKFTRELEAAYRSVWHEFTNKQAA